MNHFVHLTPDNKVYADGSSENDIVKVPALDTRLHGTTYDPVTGTFSGHKIVLTVDKPQITADGIDTAIITATVKNWDDAPSNAIPSIIFQVDGVAQPPVATTNGVAELVFGSLEPKTHSITTANTDAMLMSNGSVSVVSV